MAWFRGPAWPVPSHSELVKLSQLLVIDDKDFEYLSLFEEHGYHITKWNQVKNLSQLESGEFHVILLDMRGISANETEAQGAGLIDHIKAVNPAQYVIAYSSARFTLDYQRFFEQADDSLRKGEDFARFKRSVDAGLAYRFSEAYYDRILQSVLDTSLDRRTHRAARRAMRGSGIDVLRRRLEQRGVAPADIDRVLTVVSIGANSLSLLAGA